MRYSMVLTVLCLWISVGGLPVRAQAAKGPDSPTRYAAAESARRQELEETARAASLAAENATDAKARDEALRQKRIAEIELEVARAAERRGVQPSTAPTGQVMAQTIVRPAAPEQRTTPQTETVREPARATTRAEARRQKEAQRLAVEKEKAARLEADLERTKEELVRKIKSEGLPAQTAPGTIAPAPQNVVVKATAAPTPTSAAPVPTSSASASASANSSPVLTVTPAGLAESRARMRELLDQKLEELKVPNPPKKTPSVASTKTESRPAASPAAAVTAPESTSAAVTPAPATDSAPAPTVIRAASLPTVQELEAEAKARRDRERQAAEQARQRVREEELKNSAATAVVATPERSPEPAAPVRIETVVAAPQKLTAKVEESKPTESRKPEAPVLTAAAQTTSSSAAQTIVQAPAAPAPTAPLLQNEDALRRIADEADAADRKAREARQAMEEELKRARATKPSIEPPKTAKEVKAATETADESAKTRSREEARIRAQMEARMKEEARQREKEEKARARELKKAAEKAGAPVAPASVTPAISAPTPAAPAASQPPVLSGSREDKLKQLLEAYRSGAINALDYHRERSKVLSQ